MPAETAARPEKNGGLPQTIAFIALLCILAFLPLFSSDSRCGNIEHDEAHYILVSKVILDGGTMYRDVYDNKLPLFYFLTSLAERSCGTDFFCIRTLVLGINLAIALVIFAISSGRMGGLLKYQPPIIFLLYASLMQTDIFLRCEPFILLFWALGLFFLDRFISKGGRENLAAAGFFAALPLFIKPLAALGLALPIAYVLLARKKDVKGNLAYVAAGVAPALLACVAYSLIFTDFGAFFGQAAGWDANGMIAAILSHDFLRADAVYFLLVAGMSVPFVPVLLDRKRGEFWDMALLFYGGVAALFFLRGFSFWLYTLAIPYFLIPLSFAWAPFIPWLRALAAPSGSLGENLKRYALAWVCAALIALSFLLLATLNYAQLHTSSAISSCGGSGELVAEMKADGNGTLFVFPSRSGYYAILGKKPLFPLIYHHTVSDVPQTDAWLEERVLAPVEAAMPDHILYFNGSNDRRSFGERSLGEWEAFLGKNYRAEYFNVSGDEAIYYSKIAGRTQ